MNSANSRRYYGIIWHNFLKLTGILILINSMLATVSFRYAAETVEREFSQANAETAQRVAQRVTATLSQCQRVAANLMINQNAQFFFSDSPRSLFEDMENTLMTMMSAYLTAMDFVHSIYLYSPRADRIMTATQSISAADFKDTDWISQLNESDEAYITCVRSVEGLYPFVLSIIGRHNLYGVEGVVVMNVDLRKLSGTLGNLTSEYQKSYLIDAEGRLICRDRKQELYEDIGMIAELGGFTANLQSAAHLDSAADVPYAYAQVYCEKYQLYCASVIHLREYTAKISGMRATILAFASILLLASIAIALYFSRSTVKPLSALAALLANPTSAAQGRYQKDQYYQQIASRIVSLVQTNSDLKTALDERIQLLRQTQAQALQLQINPHFLFNTLNLINASVAYSLGEEHTASRMTVWLSQLLRYSLDSTDLVTLETEVRHTEIFLNILQARYSGLFNVRLSIASQIRRAPVPKLFLQPLIENAVYHGLAARDNMRGGTVEIIGEAASGHRMRLRIRDNGRGMDPDSLARLTDAIQNRTELGIHHIGVSNVVMRLRLLYSDRFSIQITSAPEQGTEVLLILPDAL